MIRALADAAVEWRDANDDYFATFKSRPTDYDAYGAWLRAHDEARQRAGKASEALREAIAEYEMDEGEKAEARASNDYYGGSGPVTLREQHEAAHKLKGGL